MSCITGSPSYSKSPFPTLTKSRIFGTIFPSSSPTNWQMTLATISYFSLNSRHFLLITIAVGEKELWQISRCVSEYSRTKKMECCQVSQIYLTLQLVKYFNCLELEVNPKLRRWGTQGPSKSTLGLIKKHTTYRVDINARKTKSSAPTSRSHKHALFYWFPWISPLF